MTATLPATARDTITGWLGEFEAAVSGDDIERAARLFGNDSYWRDLIAFSWNIVTVEGPDGVRDLLCAPWNGCSPAGSRSPTIWVSPPRTAASRRAGSGSRPRSGGASASSG